MAYFGSPRCEKLSSPNSPRIREGFFLETELPVYPVCRNSEGIRRAGTLALLRFKIQEPGVLGNGRLQSAFRARSERVQSASCAESGNPCGSFLNKSAPRSSSIL